MQAVRAAVLGGALLGGVVAAGTTWADHGPGLPIARYVPRNADEAAIIQLIRTVARGWEAKDADVILSAYAPDALQRAWNDPARMIALHHRTQMGLEAIAKRSEHLKDPMVQRRLLRNPQIPGTMLNRILNPKLMMEVYKVAIDREIPERSRVLSRESLR